jgi:hypothetical protein
LSAYAVFPYRLWIDRTVSTPIPSIG